MKVIAGVISATSEEELKVMGDISLWITMGNLDRAKKLAEDNNLIDYYNLEIKQLKGGIK